MNPPVTNQPTPPNKPTFGPVTKKTTENGTEAQIPITLNGKSYTVTMIFSGDKPNLEKEMQETAMKMVALALAYHLGDPNKATKISVSNIDDLSKAEFTREYAPGSNKSAKEKVKLQEALTVKNTRYTTGKKKDSTQKNRADAKYVCDAMHYLFPSLKESASSSSSKTSTIQQKKSSPSNNPPAPSSFFPSVTPSNIEQMLKMADKEIQWNSLREGTCFFTKKIENGVVSYEIRIKCTNADNQPPHQSIKCTVTDNKFIVPTTDPSVTCFCDNLQQLLHQISRDKRYGNIPVFSVEAANNEVQYFKNSNYISQK